MAQPASSSRFLYSVKLTFQAYGLPFKNLAESFTNGGGAIWVDYAYNMSQTLFQSFSIGYQGHTQHKKVSTLIPNSVSARFYLTR